MMMKQQTIVPSVSYLPSPCSPPSPIQALDAIKMWEQRGSSTSSSSSSSNTTTTAAEVRHYREENFKGRERKKIIIEREKKKEESEMERWLYTCTL